MTDSPEFDVAKAHKYFAAHCFNQAWGLMEKPERSLEEDRLMAALSYASIYHWTQRDDCSAQTLAIGYWQASRIQALSGNPAEALRNAQICLSYSEELPPFYLGYAYEALARAQHLAGNAAAASEAFQKAVKIAEGIGDEKDRANLLAALNALPIEKA